MKKFYLCLVLCYFAFYSFAEPKNEVLEFSATVKDKSILLSWKIDMPSTHLLYRSKNPFHDFSSLSDAILLSSFTDTENDFLDNPPLETNYYYAVVFVQDVINPNELQFIVGKNTLTEPIKIKSEIKPVTDDKVSLPLLNLNGHNKKSATKFSDETETKIQKLQNKYKKYSSYVKKLKNQNSSELKFFRFLDETDSTQNASSLSLKRILDKSEKNESWIVLENELKAFLRLSHQSEIKARAKFYLAESLFFQNNYEKAILQFLEVSDFFKEKTKIWIDACLDKLSKKP